MNRVVKRTWLMGLFILVLVLGMVFFLGDYWMNAPQWIGAPSSGYMHNDAIGFGSVTDRAGVTILEVGQNKAYSPDPTTRLSTLHWLGDRQGNIVSRPISEYAADMSGYDVVDGVYDFGGIGGTMELTLSVRAQNAAYNAMAGRKGTVAVYNYETGEILCAITTPTFDPDDPIDLSAVDPELYEGVYLNRFAQSTYIPGSIFKVVTTAAALDCVPDIEKMKFTCTGILEYGEEKVSCERAHGTQDLKLALANSCNCAFAQVAELVGKDRMTDYVSRFGILDPVSFDGVTTAKGHYDVSDAAPVSFAWSCIGQYTDLINPCRFMTFMGAIAGDGACAQPYLVSHVTGGGETTYSAEIQQMDPILSPEVTAKLREYMRGNVEMVYGAGNFPGLTVCAKSGTSQLGGDLTSNAMFAGFVTDPEYPLAFICVVENGGYGASACVPVVSRVLDACKTVLDAE